MKHDLLFCNDCHKVGETDINFTENFDLKTLFGRFSTDAENLNYFIDVLLNPLTDADEINYRREILDDFQKNPDMLMKLERVFKNLVLLKNKNIRERAMGIGGRIETVLSRNAQCLKNLLIELKIGAGVVSRMTAQSRGLKKLIDRMREIEHSSDIENMILQCSEFACEKKDNNYVLLIKTNETAKICDIDIVCDEAGFKINGAKNAIFNPHNEEYSGYAMKYIADKLFDTEKNIYNEFDGMIRQLSFYDIALRYIGYIKNKGYPFCLPDINSAGETVIYSLYDAVLCVSVANVVSNDVLCMEHGSVIYGENNSGKTVYLRSLGLAQIMFQAGLPIIAQSGSMPVRRGIYSLFSSPENYNAQDISGRFEDEARGIKEFFDKIDKDSLVLLNEPFQTTDYDEGSECLYYILKSVSAMGATWFMVTHLQQLVERFEYEGSAKLIKMTSEHTIDVR